MRAPPAVGLLLALLLAAGPAGAEDRVLRFERDGVLVRSVPLSELRARCRPRRVEVPLDPYYGRTKHFLACPLAGVLELGFGSPDPGRQGEFFFRALDAVRLTS